ncbi:MAG TPA: DMT family transporter, partial [Pyrinomonadaceae bacterium]|nr:DMT family transporter [Pyrinomonadaceae bacterium]
MSPASKSFKPHLALVAVQIFFGTWPIVGKIALRTLPSTGLVAFRVAGATLAFLILRRLTTRPRITRRSDYARLALYSLLGVVLNQFLYVKGLALSTAINATILSTTIPIAALLVSVMSGRERPAPRVFVGMLIAACGVVYLVNPAHADFSRDTMIGNLLLILNTLAYGAYIAISQDVIKRYGALTVITWVFLFGCIATLPVGGYYLAQTPLTHLSIGLWLALAYIILVPTVGAY